MNAWLSEHPLIFWMYNHPLIALISILLTTILTIRLLVTIYRAIAKAIDSLWLGILRSPWRLVKFLFGWSTQPKAINSPTAITSYEVTNNSQQLQMIAARLDRIEQQQLQIIEDLAELKQQPVAFKLKQIQLAEEKL